MYVPIEKLKEQKLICSVYNIYNKYKFKDNDFDCLLNESRDTVVVVSAGRAFHSEMVLFSPWLCAFVLPSSYVYSCVAMLSW